MSGLAVDAEALALEILGELEMGIVVCDLALTAVAFVNLAAERCLRALDPTGTPLPEAFKRVVAVARETEPTSRAFTPAVALTLDTGRRLFIKSKLTSAGRLLVTITSEVLRESELFALLHERFDLSWREFQVVSLLRSGSSNQDVARRLNISIGTVKQYLNKIFKTFDVHSRGELTAAVERLSKEERTPKTP